VTSKASLRSTRPAACRRFACRRLRTSVRTRRRPAS
jgi:hypothetical protein